MMWNFFLLFHIERSCIACIALFVVCSFPRKADIATSNKQQRSIKRAPIKSKSRRKLFVNK